MKICLLGDTHFGIRNDSKIFHEYYEEFYDEIFFPYLKQNGIDTVIQLGDLFDRRKYINFLSLTESRRYFFDKLRDNGIRLHALIGNHDIFYKHTLDVNSPELLLKDYDNITLWNKEGTLTLADVEQNTLAIDMIPWMCNDNEKRIISFINSSVSPICLGHFELLGFEMSKGVESHEGINSKFLSKYDHVYSGHYHTKSTNKNVTYLGTPYELFWSDYRDSKGFYVLDTKDSSVQFVENPLRMFYKINYNDADGQELDLDYSEYTDAYVKVVVINKQNPFKFDSMLDALYKALPADVTVVEDFTEASLEGDDDDIDQAEDTVTILSNFIDQQNLTNVDGIKLKTLMRELYVEALSSETIE